MMQSPFIRVLVNPKEGDQIEITDMVTNFVFEQSIEKDNLVEFDIVSSYVDLVLDMEGITNGSELNFLFGYSGGSTSQMHTAIITDVEPTFSHMNINLKIRALDKGTQLKKTSSSQIYENATSTDIAKLIATRHGLKFQVDVTERVWEKQPQGNLDDLSFLRKLASQEKSGNYITYIQDNILFFVRRGLDTPSIITYTYGEGNNGILLFAPRWRESTADADGMGSSGVGFDSSAKEFNTSSETAESENEVITTGDYHLVYSANGDYLANGTENENVDIEGFVEKNSVNGEGVTDFSQSGLSDIIKTGKQFVSGAIGTDLSDKIAGSKKSGTQKILEAKLTVVGNPLMKINALLTMKNVTKRFDGNWFIVGIRHTISSGGFITENTLSRNASKKADTSKNTKKSNLPNNTVGDSNGVEDEIIILQYDANGERTADITKAGAYVPPQKI